jgi:RNA polymerase sigma-70 factor (sigma-E family)
MEWMRDGATRRQFDLFVAEATDHLFRTGYLMTGNAGDAEDLVQETFIRMARRWHRVRSMNYRLAYARRTLINLVLDNASRRSQQLAELDPAVGADIADDTAARALRHVDDLAEFCWALGELPPAQRAVLALRYWEDLSVAEVAKILGCSAGTVKSAASRGAARLAQLLNSGSQPGPDPVVTLSQERCAS